MNDKICPHCHAPIQENASFCLHCMTSLDSKRKIDIIKNNKKILIPAICAAALIIITLLSLIIILLVNGNKDNNNYNEVQPAVSSMMEENSEIENSTEEIISSEKEKNKPNNSQPPLKTQSESKKTTSSEKPESKAESHNTSPHTHSYTEKIIRDATCGVDGEKVYTCKCGDCYTKNIPATGNHKWTAITVIEHHKETGHYEEQITDYKEVTQYSCFDCGKWFDSVSALKSHFKSQHSWEDNFEWLLAHVETLGNKKTVNKPIYENVWVVDKPAYDSTKVTGYKCSICGAKK